MRGRRGEFGFAKRQIVGFGDGVDARTNNGMLDRFFDELAEQINSELPPAQRIYVIFACFERRRAACFNGWTCHNGVQ